MRALGDSVQVLSVSRAREAGRVVIHTCEVSVCLIDEYVGANDPARQAQPRQEAFVTIVHYRVASPRVLPPQAEPCHCRADADQHYKMVRAR